MKLVSIKYDDDLKDYDINYIKQVVKIYDKVLRGQKQELLNDVFGLSVLSSQPSPSQVTYPSQNTPMALATTLFNKSVV